MQASENEMLQFALENGIIDIDTIQTQIEMNERKKYLNLHKNEIWKGKDGKYRTYLIDEEAKSGRRQVVRKTKKEIENVIIKFYKSKNPEPTVEDIFLKWINRKLEYCEIQRQTYDRYTRDFESSFEKIRHLKIRYISEDKLEEFIKTTIRDQNLTAKRWSNVRLILKGIFKYAKKTGYTNISITEFMGDLELSRKIFKHKKRNDYENVFTDDEVKKIFEYVKNDTPNIVRYGILLTFYTGLRVGELVALTYADINMYERYINVNKTEVRYKGDDGKYVYEVRDSAKTDAGDRKVIIPEEALTIIKEIRKLNPFGRYIFTQNGKRVNTTIFDKSIRNLCKSVGIPIRSMHKIRKTYATKLINAGVSDRLIIDQMGHTDISTTRMYYYYNNFGKKEAEYQLKNALMNFG